jgi:epoxyqueuosine reductase
VPVTSSQVQQLAYDCGFEIAGVTPALPHPDFNRFLPWSRSEKSAQLTYLTDRRAALRADPRSLLPNAQTIICLGKLYNTNQPFSTEQPDPAQGWIARYAWGLDYHDVLRPPLETLTQRLADLHGQPFDSKICIDTVPLLERSYARSAGLGWIGKNTCLIHQQYGSWFFLAELLVSFAIASGHAPAPDRCGTCTRCIDACPTAALIPNPGGGCDLDASLCISCLTIETHGPIPPDLAALHGRQIFGCDICQDVCPWNHRARRSTAAYSSDIEFAPNMPDSDLALLSTLAEDDFRRLFRRTPIWRAKYEGFVRNVAIAMGNSRQPGMRQPLLRLTTHPNRTVSQTAFDALLRLESSI